MSSETVTSLGQLSVEVEAVTEVGRTQGKGEKGRKKESLGRSRLREPGNAETYTIFYLMISLLQLLGWLR